MDRLSFPEKSANEVASTSEAEQSRIFDSGGLGWGGFFGGPLAISYLIYRDLVALRRTDLLPSVFARFVPCILFWLLCVLSFPPDLITQWIYYLPQTILWWILSRHLLTGIYVKFVAAGGSFKSRWTAVGFGFFTFLGLKLFFYVLGALGWL